MHSDTTRYSVSDLSPPLCRGGPWGSDRGGPPGSDGVRRAPGSAGVRRGPPGPPEVDSSHQCAVTPPH
eukprot:2595885-Prymnesium_polylepis.1